jgi:hypothetical protein
VSESAVATVKKPSGMEYLSPRVQYTDEFVHVFAALSAAVLHEHGSCAIWYKPLALALAVAVAAVVVVVVVVVLWVE